MFYKFPHIEHIDQVLPAIEGSTEFIVAERGDFKVINYLVNMPDTFPPMHTAGGSAKMREQAMLHKAIRRECRGLIFCSNTGRILRRPLFKFFNINERDETSLKNLDFTLPHKVYTKLDGSMISPFEVGYKSGVVRFGTKMGITEVSKQAEDFIMKNSRYMSFSMWCIENDITPIYEWTSRKNRIVIDYPEDNLILIACRHMITGEFFPL